MRQRIIQETDNGDYVNGWLWGFITGVCVSIAVYVYYIF